MMICYNIFLSVHNKSREAEFIAVRKYKINAVEEWFRHANSFNEKILITQGKESLAYH